MIITTVISITLAITITHNHHTNNHNNAKSITLPTLILHVTIPIILMPGEVCRERVAVRACPMRRCVMR